MVARNGEYVIPVLMVVTDCKVTATQWAQRLLAKIVEQAKRNKVPMPFDPKEVSLYNREEFNKIIGTADQESPIFSSWYTYSKFNFLRFRMGWELARVRPALRSLGLTPGSLALLFSCVAETERAWLNLDTLMTQKMDDTLGETGHDPGEECFVCPGLTQCTKGKKFILENQNSPKQLVN